MAQFKPIHCCAFNQTTTRTKLNTCLVICTFIHMKNFPTFHTFHRPPPPLLLQRDKSACLLSGIRINLFNFSNGSPYQGTVFAGLLSSSPFFIRPKTGDFPRLCQPKWAFPCSSAQQPTSNARSYLCQLCAKRNWPRLQSIFSAAINYPYSNRWWPKHFPLITPTFTSSTSAGWPNLARDLNWKMAFFRSSSHTEWRFILPSPLSLSGMVAKVSNRHRDMMCQSDYRPKTAPRMLITVIDVIHTSCREN